MDDPQMWYLSPYHLTTNKNTNITNYATEVAVGRKFFREKGKVNAHCLESKAWSEKDPTNSTLFKMWSVSWYPFSACSTKADHRARTKRCTIKSLYLSI
jgi:hypothetical protein